MGHDITDFDTEVLQRSHEVPVLADFWAPWCGPCRTLGPILEKIAAAANGRWVFAKVNVDEHKEVASEQEISGIPDVRLFHKGLVLGSFSGVRSERDIHKFLEHHLPSPRAAEVSEARLWMEEQRFTDAAQKLEALLQAEPRNDAARMALAECYMSLDPTKVMGLVLSVGVESPFADKASALRTLARFAALTDNAGTLAESAVKPRYLQAAAALRRGDYAAALEGFIDVLSRKREYDGGGPKMACQAIFLLLGIRHPLAEKFHRAFSSALHS